ncbi:MAG: hypothetical protein GY899_04275 [Verrucomicrobiaceae bacterium]|nr:hypothetical protein [Verrucomicrobiaceae bacterium]
MISSESSNQVSHSSESQGEDRGRMLSLRVIVASVLAVFLVIALGMTGGRVRKLGNRVTMLEEEGSFFQRRLESFREDNQRLLSRIRDYQDVLEVAKQSNVSLSKRLLNRDLAVEDLQRSIQSILEQKYENELRLNGQIARLEEIKRDLSARGAALSEAVAAQGKEIAQLEQSYQLTSDKLARELEKNDRLSIENEKYLGMVYDFEEKFVSAEERNRGLVERFNLLQDRTNILESEKSELKEELRGWIESEVSQPGVEDTVAQGASDRINVPGGLKGAPSANGEVNKATVVNAAGLTE